MAIKSKKRIPIRNFTLEKIRVFVEPWAERYDVEPMRDVDLVLPEDSSYDDIELEIHPNNWITIVAPAGTEFWSGDELLAHRPD